jgi:rhamnosyltransferase
LESIPARLDVARKLSNNKNKLFFLANENYIFGCTITVNKALLELTAPAPKEAINYDHWIVLHAAAFGEIYYYKVKTMLYRQHGDNASGGLKYSYFRSRLFRLLRFRTYIDLKRRNLLQFQAFIVSRHNLFEQKELNLLNRYIVHSKTGGLFSILFMVRNGFVLRGLLQTIVYYIAIFVDKK